MDDIGVGDLDPLAAGGGGMMFDPLRSGMPRHPRGGGGYPGGLPRFVFIVYCKGTNFRGGFISAYFRGYGRPQKLSPAEI